MTIQIDIKPVFIGQHIKDHFIQHMYINGIVFTSTVHKTEVQNMLGAEIIKPVKRQLRNDATGKIETYNYPNGVDGAGVMYTSNAFQIIK